MFSHMRAPRPPLHTLPHSQHSLDADADAARASSAMQNRARRAMVGGRGEGVCVCFANRAWGEGKRGERDVSLARKRRRTCPHDSGCSQPPNEVGVGGWGGCGRGAARGAAHEPSGAPRDAVGAQTSLPRISLPAPAPPRPLLPPSQQTRASGVVGEGRGGWGARGVGVREAAKREATVFFGECSMSAEGGLGGRHSPRGLPWEAVVRVRSPCECGERGAGGRRSGTWGMQTTKQPARE